MQWKSWLPFACNASPSPFVASPMKSSSRQPTTMMLVLLVQDELYWKWYKGSLNGRLVSIRKFEGSVHIIEGRGLSNYIINDLVISAKISAHNNVLKLIGCCLETWPPILVHEFAANGGLANRFQGTCGSRQHQPLTWISRLKIAREIAHAISYLTTKKRFWDHRTEKRGLWPIWP